MVRSSDTRTGASPGTVRAFFTLAGVAAAGLLVWVAQTADLDSAGEFWGAMAVLLVAGFALGLSQLFGGWTKWGPPVVSLPVFLIAFLPTFIVALWILLAQQPDDGWAQGTFSDWTGDLGLESFVDDIGTFLSIVPVVVGLVLAFSFDTSGPKARIVERYPERESQESVVEELRRKRAEGETADAGEPVPEPDEPAASEEERDASLSQGT